MSQGEAFSNLGRYHNAADRFYEAVRADPLDVSMRIYLANILMQNNYFDQAFEQFFEASKINPAFAPAYKGMGLARLKKGNRKDARRYLDKAYGLLPLDSPERKEVLELYRSASS